MKIRHFIALLTLATVAFTSAGCRSTSALWQDNSPNSTKRKFDMKKKFLAGSPLKGVAVGTKRAVRHNGAGITVFLRNDGERPVTVYRSFRVDRGQFNASSDLFIEVVDAESGSRLPLAKRKWTTANDKHNINSYYQVAPFEMISDVIDVSRFYDLKRGKSYDVSVEYDHGESGFEKSGKWIEMDAWTGRIRSNKIRLVIPIDR